MHRILFMCLDAAVAAVLLAPIFWVLNRFYFRNFPRTLVFWVFAVYLSAVFAVAGLPDIRYIRFRPHFNFVPFAYMFSDYRSSFLNVVLFVPLGFLLPVLWKRFSSLWRTALAGLAASALIETLQIFTYRATDVNDLITNTFGTVVGWLLGKLLLHLQPGIRPGEKTAQLYTVCAAAFGTMFLVHPFLADWIFRWFF